MPELQSSRIHFAKNPALCQYNYELQIDYTKRIIRLYGYTLNYNWAREATGVINTIKPCNMVFINIPTMIQSVGLIYWWDGNTWNTSNWNDNNIWNEYEYLTSEELVNYNKETQSSQDFQTLLNVLGNIKLNKSDLYVLENRTISVKDDTIFIEFLVPESIKLVEYVEILSIYGSTLVETECYIDTPSGTQIVIRLSCYSQKGN